MFLTTAVLYPLALALICLGAGLLVDRVSGSFLPLVLLPSVGAAATIALTQLLTNVYPLAPSTPYVTGVAALSGFWVARARAGAVLRAVRRGPWRLLVPAIVYGIALAPVLLAGRPSFSSYMALADSAVHMVGADYLLVHGQHFAHLDLSNSYGQVVNDYYNSNYPSGADTLFGASALLLGFNLLWAFQPFNAFMLALASGPAWLLVRRVGLTGAWAGAATVSVVVPALVYAYELFGSIKEVTALALILTLGALVIVQGRWLRAGPRGVIPFALVVAGGLSALGVAFGVWALVAALVLVPALWRELRTGAPERRRALGLVGLGGLVAFVAALPTWLSLGGSVQVAEGIASTSNPGNLAHPLRAIQLFGIWLGGSYKLEPTGVALSFTRVLIVAALLCALAGVWQLLRLRALSLLAWLVLMLIACLVVAEAVTTWGSAKALMLSSPVVLLLAWAGVAAVGALRARAVAVGCSIALATVLGGGVLASDASQYHVSNLAPTARYDELASLRTRFAGGGPVLFTDFDEYSLYALRGLDVGGPDFVYPPPALAPSAGGHGRPVDLDRIAPRALAAYPLIVTRRDPQASRPPAAYGLVWEGTYYQVWRRRPGAPAAQRHVALGGPGSTQCSRLARLAGSAGSGARASLTVAAAPQVVGVALRRARLPHGWGRARAGILMRNAGALGARISIPAAGRWKVWVRGQIMPGVEVSIDGRRLATVAGQLDGNSLVISPAPPIPVELSAGTHRLVLTRVRSALAPGDGGAAVLAGVFLTPAGAAGSPALITVPATRWRALCGGEYQWAELSIGGRP